jgi:serine phosphatase RsbU (regulator of sigma subunit)
MMRSGRLISPLPQTPEHPVWTVHDHVYSTHRFDLRDEEGLFLFTRGAIRAMNSDGNEFSLERLALLLREHQSASPAEIIRHVTRTLMQFVEDAPLDEDATMMALKMS